MIFEVLDDRKQKVLRIIVEDYIHSAEPVGSKTVTQDHHVEASPATIRFDMADLEKKGYIKKPHTSAGRVPSDKGYRFFIDNILEESELSGRESESVREKMLKTIRDDIFEIAGELVSRMTGNASVVVDPDKKHIIYINGIYRMLRQPEFVHVDMTSEVVELMEKHNEMIDLLNEYTEEEEDDVSIRVGGENSPKQLKQCSVASAKYKDRGIISIVGPTRMDYKRVSSILRYFADLLEEI
ncbi:MAG: hypothetical protein NTZ10_04310 [Candidatus Saganbacteria bacterium]|nr:hypothetical protein [Candidatus Saganbacteria bacterium]